MATITTGIDDVTRNSSPTNANLRANKLTLNTVDPVTSAWNGSAETPTKDAIWDSLLDVKVIHLFALAGQSNAGVHDTGGGAPVPAAGAFQWTSSGGVEALSNSTSITDGGVTMGWSPAPQFANTYIALSGRKIGFMGSGLGGTAQVAAADSGVGNWDTSGTLRGTLVSRYATAKTAFQTAGYTVIDAGILWMQGEQDAVKIADATITQAQYETALTTMIAYFRTNINANLPFWIVRTGERTSVATTGSFSVRMGQENVANADPATHIVYRDTMNFSALGFMDDTVHYDQDGQNNIGLKSAEYVMGLQKRLVAVASTVAITADNQVVQVNEKEVINLLSNNATAANRTILLSPPLRPGATLRLVNASASFNVQLVDGGAITQSGSSETQGTVQLSSSWSSASLNDVIELVSSDGFNWVEVGRQAGGGGGGGVTSIIAGSGISVDSPTGAVTVSSTGAVSGVLASSITSATVASSVAETSVIGSIAAPGTLITPANHFVAGTVLRIEWSGFFSSLIADTLTLKIKAGSTVVASTGAVAQGAVTNQVGRIVSVVTCRAVGASGTFIVNTFFETPLLQNQLLNTATVTLDTTATLAWDVTAQWGTSSASNTITGTNFVMSGFGTIASGAALTNTLAATITSTVATPADTGLEVAVEASSTYAVEIVIACGCNNTGGLLFGIVSGVTVGDQRIIGIGAGATTTSFTRWVSPSDTIVSTPINPVNSTAGFLRANGTILTTTSGTVKLQYQPAVGGQTATIFKAGTYLKLTKL